MVNMAPRSPLWLPSTPSIPYNINDNLMTHHASSTSCLDYPLHNIDHSITIIAYHKTKPIVFNTNSNPQGSKL